MPMVISNISKQCGDPATGLPFGDTASNLRIGDRRRNPGIQRHVSRAWRRTARDEGFDEIADWFETLAKAERSHANRFQKALNELE